MDTTPGGWRRLGDFPCVCGVVCRQWGNDLLQCWRVQHGNGEAARTFRLEEIVDSVLPNGRSVWSDWVEEVHHYEGAHDGGQIGGDPGQT